MQKKSKKKRKNFVNSKKSSTFAHFFLIRGVFFESFRMVQRGVERVQTIKKQ